MDNFPDTITMEIQEILVDSKPLYEEDEISETQQGVNTEPVAVAQEPNPVVEPVVELQQGVISEPDVVSQELNPVVEPIVAQEPNPVATTHTPKLVFIVPYRDREQHLLFFSKHMSEILSVYPKDDVRIFYVHQCDLRSFNRGAMKNIGFLTVKKEYPETYKDITLVFNDVDTMPFSKGFLDYETTHGKVKHFYGYTFALGGIVSITAGDFEILGGFPNLWTWGYEDNLLNYRVLINKEINVDRSQFFPIMDKNIMHLGDGLERTVNRKEFDVYIKETPEGYHTITELNTLLEPRKNDGKLDEVFVQVLNFNTGRNEDVATSKTHSISQGNKPFGDVRRPPQQVLHRRGSARMGLVLR